MSSVKPESIGNDKKVTPRACDIAAQKLRTYRLEKRKIDPKIAASPGIVSFFVLGNGANGNPASIFLSTDHHKYLFNCGEGVQRLAYEFGTKLTQIENIFISRKTWSSIGSLPGLSMTLQGLGVPEINIHGPAGLDILYELSKPFGVNNELTVINQRDNMNYNDSCFHIEFIPLRRQSLPPCDFGVSPKKMRLDNEQSDAFCYWCKMNDRPGTLIIDKCIEFGVPKGPLLGKLKSGQNIVLDNGRTVYAADVTGTPEKGTIVLIVDCPSADYLDSFLNSKLIQKSHLDTIGEQCELIFHLAPREIIENILYQQWISCFTDSTKHIVVNESNDNLSFLTAQQLQTKLNLIDEIIFPMIYNAFDNNFESKFDRKISLLPAITGLKYTLHPSAKKGFDFSECVRFDRDEITGEAIKMPGFKENLEEYRRLCSTMTTDDIEVIFFGTGSAVPGKKRTSSSILIKINDEKSILLDCGEGTYGQFYRFFGKKCADELSKVSAIFISHVHADHQIGLITILQQRHALHIPPIHLIAPIAVLNWLSFYSEKFEKITKMFVPVNCGDCLNGVDSDNLLRKCRLRSMRTVKVLHCFDSYGIVLETAANPVRKIVYSGDTMPTRSLIEAGFDCDLLIHEATMGDDLVEEAALKRHSTYSQAVGIANEMNAKWCILTHFSQRYTIPLISDNFPDNVGIAFDNMRVKFGDLWKLSKLIKPLKSLFAEHLEFLVLMRKKKTKKEENMVDDEEKFDA